MRVISGSARGRRLKRVPGDTTRPIMDRVKESLFNILRDHLYGAYWLDMFAGTGAVGIEALSRGGESVIFLDLAKAAIQTIYKNLESTDLMEGATVVQTNSLQFVGRYGGECFDIIYIAPPQYKQMWEKALLAVDARPEILEEDGQVIVQIDPKEFKELALKHLEIRDQRKYGKTMLVFYRLKVEIEADASTD